MYRLDLSIVINAHLVTLTCEKYSGKSQPYPSEKAKIAQNEMKSKLDAIEISVAELKTPKSVIAFRVTCAKNFSSGYTTSKIENPGKMFLRIIISFIVFH